MLGGGGMGQLLGRSMSGPSGMGQWGDMGSNAPPKTTNTLPSFIESMPRSVVMLTRSNVFKINP